MKKGKRINFNLKRVIKLFSVIAVVACISVNSLSVSAQTRVVADTCTITVNGAAKKVSMPFYIKRKIVAGDSTTYTSPIHVNSKSQCDRLYNEESYRDQIYIRYNPRPFKADFYDHIVYSTSEYGTYNDLFVATKSLEKDEYYNIQESKFTDYQYPNLTLSTSSRYLEIGSTLNFDTYAKTISSCKDSSGEATTISTNSNVTKTYTKPGEHSFDVYCTDYSGKKVTRTFTLNVGDSTPPVVPEVISIYDGEYMELGIDTNDQYIMGEIRSQITDNYNDINGYYANIPTIELSAPLVTNVAGCQSIPFTVTDYSKNVSESVLEYCIHDTKKPVLVNNQFELSVLDRSDAPTDSDKLQGILRENLVIFDYSIDPVLITVVDDDGFNQKIVDKYRVDVTLTDMYGNEIDEVVIIDVLDKEPPEIDPVHNHPIEFEVNERSFANVDWRIYISPTDNYTDVEELDIQHNAYDNAIFNRAGYRFSVTYRVTDLSGNYTDISIEFLIVKTKLPVISETCIIQVEYMGFYNIDTEDALACVSIYDNYYSLEDGTLKFSYVTDPAFRIDVIGDYSIKYYVTSDVGTTMEEGIVRVSDTTSPTIVSDKTDYIFVKDTEEYDFLADLTITDHSEVTITYRINGKEEPDLDIDFNSVGMQSFEIIVTDTSGNKAEITITVEVINLVGGLYGEYNIILDYGDEFIDPGAFVILESGENLSSEINTSTDLESELGEYRYVYYIEFENQPVIIGSRKISVVDRVKPVINLDSKDLEVANVGEIIVYLSQIEVVDNYDGVTYGVNVLGEPPTESGEMTIFSVDTSGNIAFETVNVQYTEQISGDTTQENNNLTLVFIAVSGVVALGSIAGISVGVIRSRI